MGMPCSLVPGKGPVFDTPLTSPEAIEGLDLEPNIEEKLSHVMASLRRTKALMRETGHQEKTLIGFCGAPWTLFCYMVEGGPSSEWSGPKRWVYKHPSETEALLDALTTTCIEYLKCQVDAGAQALQVFDSHAGALPPAEYTKVAWPHVERIAREMRRLRPEVTLIGFAKGNSAGLSLLEASPYDIVGVDFSWEPEKARDVLGSKACMGNLDPGALHAPPSELRKRVHAMMDGLSPAGRGLVANLGHGVGVSTDPASVSVFVDAVRSWRSRETVVIASRKSKLAMVQTEWVQGRLKEDRPENDYTIQEVVSTGDKIQNIPLSAIGDTGLFTKQLETELLSGRVDLAVHSLKDVETKLPAGLTLCAISEREDPCDIMVPNPTRPHIMACKDIMSLPPGAVVGTSAVRRQAQIKLLRQDLVLKDVRGNVQTRLQKLLEGYDVLIMAKAGFERLGYLDEGPNKVLAYPISPKEMLHAVGQGALACECRTADVEMVEILQSAIGHADTTARVTAERSFLRSIGGGCQVPLGVFTEVKDGTLYIEGGVFATDGSQSVRALGSGPVEDAVEIGLRLAKEIHAQGGGDLMAAISRD